MNYTTAEEYEETYVGVGIHTVANLKNNIRGIQPPT